MLGFVLAGAPKCGTTSIATGLAACEGICLSDPKETFFFNPEFEAKHTVSTLQDYGALFSGPGMRGDGSIWSMYSPSFPRRLLQMSPDARIILSLRSPERMVASLYHYNLDKSYENAPDLLAAFEREEARSRGHDIPGPCPEPTYLLYRQVADYTPAVERILEAVPAERVMIFDFDDADKTRIVPEICAFLGVQVPPPAPLPHDNPTSYARQSAGYDMLRAAGRTMRNLRRACPIPIPSTGVIERFRRSGRTKNRDTSQASKDIARQHLEAEIARYKVLMQKHGTVIGKGVVA
ncbi:sulfotransferase domain-containing protein [Salipiger thiooxidans]|uniref:sulfotransferase n=1 Tax=Salipiger thiooxidans TaxID=282683 RepID=UPI001A90988D|nr:sulfotransferase [Salipiger thiooxidans]MBN8189816.1 sulfotransferase domain-containing protein [Salipiger thiooxidans]